MSRNLPVEESLRREPCLSDEELQSLRAIGRQIERHYGRPQDIEWAIDRHTREILLLQSRPETVWSNKDSQAAAARGHRSAAACHENFRRTTVTLTAADVAEIMRIVEQSKFDELDLEIEGVKLSLRRGGASGGLMRGETTRRLLWTQQLPRMPRSDGARNAQAAAPRQAVAAGPGRQEPQGNHLADARHILPGAQAGIRAVR